MLKTIYMPIRRVWLDDNDVACKEDKYYAIGMLLLIASTLIMCAVINITNM